MNRESYTAKAMEPETIEINGHFDVGATGAVSGTTGRGVTSVTRTGTGAYSIKLDDVFNRFEGANISIMHSTEAGVEPQLNASTLTASTKTLTFTCYDTDGSSGATDPPNGSTVFFSIRVKNTGA